MHIPHQQPGIPVHRVAAGQRHGNGNEVALLLRGDAPLMGHLMDDGGGQKAGRAVHIEVGLPGEGEVEAREVHGAERCGAADGLGRVILHPQTGELLIGGGVHRRGGGEDLLPGHGKAAILVPLHIVCRLCQLVGKVRRDGL